MAAHGNVSAQIDQAKDIISDSSENVGKNSGPDPIAHSAVDPAVDPPNGAAASAVDSADPNTGAKKRPSDTPSPAQIVKRQKFTSPSQLRTIKDKKEERRKRREAMECEVNRVAVLWETANPGISKTHKEARRKMIKEDVSSTFKGLGHHPDQIDISSKGKAAPLPANNEPPAQAGPSILQDNDDVPPVPQTSAKNDSSGIELPPAEKSEVPSNAEVIINTSNKAICDVMAARAQAAATETISKAVEGAEKIKKDAETEASQILDEAHVRANEAVAKAREEAEEVQKNAHTRANEHFARADEEAARIREESLYRSRKVLENARVENARAEKDMEEVRRQARVGVTDAQKVLHDAGEATAMLRKIKDIFDAYLSGVAAQRAPGAGELNEQPEQ